jgi:hypothetical protein
MLLLFGVALLARVHCACSAVGDVHRFGSLIFAQRERERESERERERERERETCQQFLIGRHMSSRSEQEQVSFAAIRTIAIVPTFT